MISVIGAGPVGCYSASLLAKKHDVIVYEEHKEIGKPVQCTGIVTSAIDELVDIKKSVVNKIDTIRIVAPNKKFVDVKLKKPDYVVDREKFDNYFFNKARDNGVKFFLNARFKDYSKGKMLINNKEIKTNVLVGADGPFSLVAKKNGMYGERKFMVAMQYRIKSKVEENVVETYLGYGCFGWLVPESNNIARIGVVDYKNPGIYLNKLLDERKYKILENQTGIVPVYNSKLKNQKHNVFLVGDAATQVKATTLGGLVPGLIAAEELSKSFRKYEKNWKKRIGRELWFSLLLRKRLDKYDDNKYNKLIELFRKEKIKEIIEKENRDFPSKIIFKLLMKEPRFFMIRRDNMNLSSC